MLDIVILVLLAVAVVVTLPRWSWSSGWGRLPATLASALLVVFIAYWYVVGPLL